MFRILLFLFLPLPLLSQVTLDTLTLGETILSTGYDSLGYPTDASEQWESIYSKADISSASTTLHEGFDMLQSNQFTIEYAGCYVMFREESDSLDIDYNCPLEESSKLLLDSFKETYLLEMRSLRDTVNLLKQKLNEK